MSHNSLEYSSFVALPIWRSTWATDQSSGHRKIIVRPRAIPVGVHAPRIHLPRIPVPPKNRYPTCEESEEITSSFRTCNFFDWTVTMMRPQIRDCSIPLTSPRRRVWLPSRFGVPRSMTTFLSGGTVGVQIEEFLRNPDVLDHRFKVLSARKVFGSTSLNATISVS